MATVTIERTFPAPIERVFEYLTKSDLVLKWWGHDGMTVNGNLDFSARGPWHSAMTSEEGNHFKMSGQVTSVKKPNLVAFTWGWHDENDARGPESHVMIELRAEGDDRTHFTLTHQDLADDDTAASHEQGWGAVLARLERCFQ